jgi:branched-chain amino acid transport system permease protein
VALVGAAAMVEMTYHLQLSSSEGTDIQFLWVTLDTTGLKSWIGAAAILAVGALLFEIARRRFAREWEEIQAFIEKKMNPEDVQ